MSRCLICDAEVDPTARGALVQRFEGFDPVYYCPAHAHRAAEKKRKRARDYELKREVSKKGRVSYSQLARPRIMRRSLPALRPEVARLDRVHPPMPEDIEKASEESAYASSGDRDTLITDAGEAVPKSYDNVLMMQARGASVIRDEERREEAARRQARAVTEAIRDLLIECAKQKVDPTTRLAAIQRQVELGREDLRNAA